MDRPKIDFARIKREVLVVDVARRYGIDLTGRGTWLHGKCPLPTHESKDSKSSFAVNVAENYWLCHSDSCRKNRVNRHGGDVIAFTAVKENCQPYEAATKLIEWYHLNEAPPPKAVSPVPELQPEKPLPPAAENKPLAFAF